MVAGIGCGHGIPAFYASVPDAMCWLDWVMTCLPLAEADVEDRQQVDATMTIITIVIENNNNNYRFWQEEPTGVSPIR